jgi:hypothetical protein
VRRIEPLIICPQAANRSYLRIVVEGFCFSFTKLHFFYQVQHEILAVYANQLLEKEHSGCHALLRDDKVISLGFILI